MDDASLEEFLDETVDDGEETADDVSDGDDADDAGDTDGRAAESTDSEPIDADSTRSTYAWDPAGVACADCGTVVERCWRDGDGFVCVECKAW